MNILITGANGFVAKNFISYIKQSSKNNIFEYYRNSTIDDLSVFIDKIDFIFHFAAEVRPNASASDYEDSNTNLTKQIVDLLLSKKLSIPIVLLSSIHAVQPKNNYGHTKLKSENILKNYANNNLSTLIIYRLPHLFGPYCKPNYNSVISTWINNRLLNKECLVYDRDIKLTYLYVQDLCSLLLNDLNEPVKQGLIMRAISKDLPYSISLGDLLDLIEIIIISKHKFEAKTSFERNLVETIASYSANIQ